MSMPLLPCAYKQLFGFSCPLCGFQRSMLLLLDGQVWASIIRFPIWPLLALWLVCFAGMSIAGKARFFLALRTPWIILLVGLLFNMIWQNIY